MALNGFDEALDQLDQETPAGTAPARNPFESVVEQLDQEGQTQLRGSVAVATQVDPDRRAKAEKIAKSQGLPVDTVERNFDQMQRTAKIRDTPFQQILDQSPVLGTWLQEPAHAAIAHDDMENLGALEWLMTAPQRAMAQGVDQVRFAQLKTESMFRPLTREEQDQLNAYKFGMTSGGNLGAGNSWWRSAVTGAGQLLPNIAGGAWMALKYGAAGAVETGAIGGAGGAAVGALGAGAGAVPGAVAGATAGAGYGFRAGALYGAGKFGFQLEAGLALDEFEGFRDETGKPLSRDVMLPAAMAVGLLNAGLEAYGLEKLAETVPGVKQLTRGLTRDAVKEALKRPTVRAALAEAMKDYAGTLTAEVATEVAQRAVTILGGELAKTASGQEIAHRTGRDIFQDLLSEGIGALEGFALTVVPGPAMQVAHAQQQARQAEGNADFFRAMGEGVTASKLSERAPEALQDLLERAVENGPIPVVYAPVDTWTTYWQSKGVDPADMAAKVTGDPKALETALASGTDLPIPTSRYATTIAPSEHNEYFANELRFAPDEWNTRESAAFRESEVAKADQQQQTESTAQPDRVGEALRTALEGAGVPANTAQRYALLVSRAVNVAGGVVERDPYAILSRYGIEIARPLIGTQTKAEAPAGGVQDGDAPAALEGAAAEPSLPPTLSGLEGTNEDVTPAVPSTGSAAVAAQSAGAASTVAGADEPIDAMQNIGAAVLRMMAEDPRLVENAAAMRERALASPRTVVDNNAPEAQDQGNAAAAQTGEGPGHGEGERARADAGGSVEGAGDGGRAELRRLPSIRDVAAEDADQPFQRADAEEDTARLTPEVRNELQRIAEELDEFPFVGRTWTWLEGKDGNAAGGGAEIVAGAAGAKVYDDVLAFSPLNKGRGAAGIAKSANATRAKVEADILKVLEDGAIHNNIAEGAVRVAERRAAGDYREISRPLLPPTWGEEAPKEFTDALSDAIDESVAEGALEEDADTSFDPSTFGQSLFDALDTMLTPDKPRPTHIGIAIGSTGQVVEASSFEDAGQKFDEARDAFSDEHGPGARDEFPDATIIDLDTGKPFARIAWNGRMFRLDDGTEVERNDGRGYGKAPAIDVLDTGEQQPRLPGAGDVREQNVETPQFEAPFALTSPTDKGTKGKQTTLFQSGVELTNEDVRAFAEEVKKEVGPDLQHFDVFLTSSGDIELGMLAVDGAVRSVGIGTQAMRRLTEFADEHGKRIVLTPASKDDGWGTTSRARLIRFYRRFGFVQNTGRNKDFAIRDGMYREPTRTLGQAARTDTPAFRTWFGASKVVDEQGKPLVVYHGTQRLDRFGPTLKKSRATSGPMPFFTADRDVASRYAEQKQDTSLSREEAGYETWFRLKTGRTTVNMDRAWYFLEPADRARIASLAPRVTSNDQNEILLGPEDETSGTGGYDQHILEQRGNHLAALVEEWLNSGNLFGDEKDFLQVLKLAGVPMDLIEFHDPHADRAGVAPVYLSIANPLVTDAMTDDDVAALEKRSRRQRAKPEQGGADIWDKLQRDPQQWIEQLKTDRAEGINSFVWSSIPDWVTDELKKRGYDGIHDVGGKMGGVEHDVWVPFEPGQVKSALGNRGTFDRSSGNMLRQDRRGEINIGANRQIRISLFERADLSTFLHESGHFFLELYGDLVEELQAKPADQLTLPQQRLLRDWQQILGWMGVEHRSAIKEAQHEQWARTFEAYLMEGRAPSLALQEAFSRFRAWLLGVYRSLVSLKADLTPEIRGVFDRMLATEDEIAAAEARGRMEPLFTTAESAGMTLEQFDLYRAQVEDASRTAREQLDAKMQAEVRREQTAQWKARRTEVREEVAAVVQQQPVYQALSAIRSGTNPDGTSLIEGMQVPPLKLSKQAIVARYGEERLKRLPKPYVYTNTGGVSPDLVAERFGFTSGDELITAIEQAPSMNAAIEQETSRRMIAEHGAMLLDGTASEEAQRAVANDVRDGVIRAEQRALADLARQVKPFVQQAQRAAKQQARDVEKERAYERRWLEAEARLRIAIAEGKKQAEIDVLEQEVTELKAKARGGAATIRNGIPPLSTIVQTAKERIARTRVRDLSPAVFWSASRRAAAKAVEHAARQEFDEAIAAKTQELLNLNLYREAERAKADVEERVIRARELTKDKVRAKIGLAGETFLEQIDGILDRFDFAKRSAKDLAKRARMRDWMEALDAEGLPVEDLPVAVQDDLRRVNFRDVSYEELVGITDGLKQIVHLAQLRNRQLKADDAETFSAKRDALVESIRANNDRKALPLEFDEAASRKLAISDIFASHTKASILARMLDGHQDGGAFWEAFVRPLNAAADAEQDRRTVEGETVRGLVEQFYPRREARLTEKVFIPAIGGSLTKEGRLAVALNWGNEISRSRILADPTRRWSQASVAAILDTLDANDWRFVQAVWDYVDKFWPEVAAKQERVTGIAPEKVDAAPVETKFGTFAGGYYPLMYDSRLVARAAQNEAAGEAKLAEAAAYVRTTTKRGHTIARVANVKLSVRLDIGVLFQHVDQVIHDLTHHETLIDVTRTLRDPRVSQVILETRGAAVYQQFTRLLQDVAAGSTNGGRTNVMDKAANWLRTGTQLSLLGWNFWTAAQQPLGLFNGMERVGVKWVAKGMARWLRDAATLQATTTWIAEVSPFMRDRVNTATQDIAEVRQRFLQPGGWFDNLLRTVTLDTITQKTIVDSYLWHIGLMQRVADVPTWLGAYEKAMAGGEDESRAVALADQAIRDSQGGGQIVDLAQVQRGSPVAKLFLTFYSYGNVVFNNTAAAVDRTSFKSPAQVGTLLGHLGLLYVMPALGTVAMAHALGKKRGDDEPEDWLREIGEEVLGTALNTMVFVRELSALVGDGTRGYAGPAGVRTFQLIYTLANQLKQGEVDEALLKALNQVAGIVFRYPAAQVERTVAGATAIDEGRTQNPAALLVGPTPKRR